MLPSKCAKLLLASTAIALERLGLPQLASANNIPLNTILINNTSPNNITLTNIPSNNTLKQAYKN